MSKGQETSLSVQRRGNIGIYKHFLSGPTRGIQSFHRSVLISSPINATHSLFSLRTIMLLCILMPSITERLLITQPPLLKAYRTPSQLKESRYVQFKTWLMSMSIPFKEPLRSECFSFSSALLFRREIACMTKTVTQKPLHPRGLRWLFKLGPREWFVCWFVSLYMYL